MIQRVQDKGIQFWSDAQFWIKKINGKMIKYQFTIGNWGVNMKEKEMKVNQIKNNESIIKSYSSITLVELCQGENEAHGHSD